MGTPLRVLIVEDSEDDAMLLIHALRRGGYAPVWEQVQTEAAMREALAKETWDIIICDHNMPEFNSLAALGLMKEREVDVPFIIVSGTIGEDIAVAAMKAGAQDYIIKGHLSRLTPAVDRELQEAGNRQAKRRAEDEVRRSYQKVRKAMEGAVQAMALMAEMRDPYTAGHERGVTELAVAIAREMGLSEDQVEGLRLAGTVHDIGKISIPTEILCRPGRITATEYSIIKTHPQISYNILKTIEFPWPVAQIALQHHERWDGSGYPHGIKGEKILLEARILGVADVVHAMACHRPYRVALGVEKAVEEICARRGLLYDSNVVDACLVLIKDKGFVFSH